MTDGIRRSIESIRKTKISLDEKVLPSQTIFLSMIDESIEQRDVFIENFQKEISEKTQRIDALEKQNSNLKKQVERFIESTRKTKIFLNEKVSSSQTVLLSMIDESVEQRENFRSESTEFFTSIEQIVENHRKINVEVTKTRENFSRPTKIFLR